MSYTEKQRKNTSWPPEKEQYLKNKWGKESVQVIAEKLKKTTGAVRNKACRLGLSRRKKAGGKKEQLYQYDFERGGVSYKKVLPPEKWPLVEDFLAAFSRYALIAEAAGKSLDVNYFLIEYKKIYVKKDVAAI